MIRPDIENVYDIILSIFLGIMFVLFFDKMYENPRIITIYK